MNKLFGDEARVYALQTQAQLYLDDHPIAPGEARDLGIEDLGRLSCEGPGAVPEMTLLEEGRGGADSAEGRTQAGIAVYGFRLPRRPGGPS